MCLLLEKKKFVAAAICTGCASIGIILQKTLLEGMMSAKTISVVCPIRFLFLAKWNFHRKILKWLSNQSCANIVIMHPVRLFVQLRQLRIVSKVKTTWHTTVVWERAIAPTTALIR